MLAMKSRTISFLALATVVLVLMWLAASFRKYKNESNDIEQRHHASSSAGVVAIVGVFSGLDSVHFARRRAQRLTWFPSSSGKLEAFQEQHSVSLRYVIGYSEDPTVMAKLEEEEERHGPVLRLRVLEQYRNLALKAVSYFEAALALLPEDSNSYILKVDDDVYFQPHRLPFAAAQWSAQGAQYTGCFMREKRVNLQRSHKWFEPYASLMGINYHTYPSGPTYAIHASAAAQIVPLLHKRRLRFLGCGDVCSVGLWMAAFSSSWLDDARLCEPQCSNTSVSVRGDSGLGGRRSQTTVAVKEMYKLHADPVCRHAISPGSTVRSRLDFSLASCYRLDSTGVLDTSGCPRGSQPHIETT